MTLVAIKPFVDDVQETEDFHQSVVVTRIFV